MERNVSFEEISDGRRYKNSDMVKIGCDECSGCSSCCENMDGLVTLDPYDVYRMTHCVDIQKLFSERIKLIVDRKVIFPTIRMDEETGKCTFLNEHGRCSIHDYRSGICRLFPLGRIYEDDGFSYFLQVGECLHENKTKVKIKNWLETPDISKYEKYICDWHFFIKDIMNYAKDADDGELNQINNILLRIFYLTPYRDGFYEDFYERLSKVRGTLMK